MLLYHSNRDNRPEYLNSLFRMSVIQKGVIMWDMAHVSYYTSVAIQNNPVRLHYSHNYSPQFSEELRLHFAALYIKQAEYSAPGVPHMGWRLRLCHASWFLSFVALFFMIFLYEFSCMSVTLHPPSNPRVSAYFFPYTIYLDYLWKEVYTSQKGRWRVRRVRIVVLCLWFIVCMSVHWLLQPEHSLK